jgi:transcriptional regulator with XRE-family HTH domain
VKKQKVKERQKIYDRDGLQLLANSLKAVRKKKGYTQEQLAYESEITLSQIARIETVKSNPTVSTIFKIARTLNINVSELFNFKL